MKRTNMVEQLLFLPVLQWTFRQFLTWNLHLNHKQLQDNLFSRFLLEDELRFWLPKCGELNF